MGRFRLYTKLPVIAAVIDTIEIVNRMYRSIFWVSLDNLVGPCWLSPYTAMAPSTSETWREYIDTKSGRMKATRLVNMIPPQDSNFVRASPW